MQENPMNLPATRAIAFRWASPLLSLIGVVPLLAVTMAAGACGSQPLGSVDAGPPCTFQGTTYGPDASFPLGDGCNACHCDSDGVARCTVKACSANPHPKNCFDPITGEPSACPDAGPAYDGGPLCFDVGGNVIDCPDGGITDGPASEASWDGATTCLDSAGTVIPCSGDGGLGPCTYLAKIYRPAAPFSSADQCQFCICSAAARIECAARDCRDGGTDGATTCDYGGKPYPLGATFPAGDGCSTCSCTSGGITCTRSMCRDAGPGKDAGVITGVCKPGQDSMCNEDPFVSTLRGKCQPDGSCLCNGAGTSGVVSPYTGKCLAPDDLTGDGCERYKTYPVGSTFPCGDSSCTCQCVGPSKVAILDSTCADAGAPTCGLDAVYIYGDVGGLRASQDQVTIAPSPTSPGDQASYLRTRNSVDGAAGISCNPPLPACGDGAAFDVSDIMADILDPVVQKYLTSDPAKPPFVGFDTRPVDGTAFSFMRGDGHGFLVGQACGMSSSASGCSAIPAAIDKLEKDLRALDDQQVRSASCAALR